MNIKDLVEEIGLTPKRKASTKGGEYASPCPFCQDGKDRFLIWPSQVNQNGDYQGGRYLCRVCSQFGDAITFLRKIEKLSYKEACEKLKIEPKWAKDRHFLKPQDPFPIAKEPFLLWQDKALLFVNWCHHQLIKNPKSLDLLFQRGFTLDIIKKYKLGFNPKNFFRDREEWGLPIQKKEDHSLKKLWLPKGLVIPTFLAEKVIKLKIRRTDWKEDDSLPKYIEVSGSKSCPSIYGNPALKALLIIESEFDAILVQQFAEDLVCCIALGGSSKPLDLQTYKQIKACPLVLFLPDFDQAGRKALEKWMKWFPHLERIFTPLEKSAGDAYLNGIDLREWLEGCLAESFRKNSKRLRWIDLDE